MGMSNFLIGNWLILLVLLGIIIFAVRFYLKLPSGRYSWDKAKLNMPLFGPIIYRVIIARFARIFDMLVKSGVPIVDSINLVSAVLGNTYMIQSIQHMGKSVEGGDSLTKAAKEADVFSPIALQMLSVGEEAGMLNDMLSEIADYYEREVDYDLDRLGDLIEPILLAVLGIMVLLIALGVFLPMWNMTSFLS